MVGSRSNDSPETFSALAIGRVRSDLKKTSDAPMQGAEGAPSAWIEIRSEFSEGIEGLRVGERLILLTWLHLADRQQVKVHARGDLSVAPTGVFSTRSPDRPNPIGLHVVELLEVSGNRMLRVIPLEAIDGTPVLDIKPVLRQELY